MLRANHKDNITIFDKDFKFYSLKDKYDYVLAVKVLGHDYLEKIRYSLNGVMLSHVTDKIVNDIIITKSGKNLIFIRDNKFLYSSQNIKLKAI